MQDCLVNGQATDLIHCSDRGLLFGDGVFETMAVVANTVPFWSLHLARLQRGCERLGLACPQEDMLRAEVEQCAQDAERAVIKLILTRGHGGRGYVSPDTEISTRILQRHPWPVLPRDYWDSGIKVVFCTLRLARQPALAGIKHLNRLEQVLARREWQDPAIQEGLLLDSEENVIEAVSHNVFLVNGKSLLTPDLQHCGVAGVMREYLISLIKNKGYSVQVGRVARQDVLAADAIFLCNSIHGVWPVCELDGKHYLQNRVVSELRDSVAQIVPYP